MLHFLSFEGKGAIRVLAVKRTGRLACRIKVRSSCPRLAWEIVDSDLR
jgi:hypothetical protein